MSLRAKWVVALVCLTATAAGAVGLLGYRVTAGQLDAEMDRSLRSAVSVAVSEARRPQGPPLVPARSPALGGVDLQLIGPDGSVVASTGSVQIPVDEIDLAMAGGQRRGSEVFRDDAIDDTPVRVLTVALGGGRGAAQGARSLEEMNRVLASLRTRILIVTLAVVLVAAVAGALIGGSVTRRLVRLTRVAEQVAETGALGAGVPSNGSDEVARLGGAFNEMLEALARSEAEQARLVQDAGHELRTPMTSLRTNIFTLRNFAELDPGTRAEVIADLEGETEELSSLIEEVLEVSSGVSPAEAVTDLEIGRLVESVADRTASRWSREVQVEVPEEVTAPVRAGQVARAVRNMVDNACKFSPAGSPIEVVVSREQHALDEATGSSGVAGPQQVLEIAVMDRGTGFEEADLDAVFARFHRSAAARSLPGSGLGLSIVSAVAQAHGGDVSASNREGGGARVAMWIPLPGEPTVH